jgi:hypothetical protein
MLDIGKPIADLLPLAVMLNGEKRTVDVPPTAKGKYIWIFLEKGLICQVQHISVNRFVKQKFDSGKVEILLMIL